MYNLPPQIVHFLINIFVSSNLIEYKFDDTKIFIKKCTICGGLWIDQIQLERVLQMSKDSKYFIKFLSEILKLKL